MRGLVAVEKQKLSTLHHDRMSDVVHVWCHCCRVRPTIDLDQICVFLIEDDV